MLLGKLPAAKALPVRADAASAPGGACAMSIGAATAAPLAAAGAAATEGASAVEQYSEQCR